VVDVRDNFLPGIDLDDIRPDFEAGAGHELEGKMRAPHSSSALADTHALCAADYLFGSARATISLTGGALAPPGNSCNQNQYRADSHLWCFAHSFASAHYGGGP
jgi:hypothetical protein